MKIAIAIVAALGTTALAADNDNNTTADIEGLGEVFFAFDSARMPSDTSSDLATVATYAEKHPGTTIVLDGHTDSTGAAPYNVRLAIRRAETVQSKLISLGVDPDRILVVTYGENGLRRTSDELDRRVTIWATEDPLHAIIDRSLQRATAVVWRDPVTAAEIDGPRVPEVATR